MKTPEQIQTHLNNLKMLTGRPCSCEANGHAEECRIGGMLMGVEICTLEWVLGHTHPDHEKLVAEIDRRAANLRRQHSTN